MRLKCELFSCVIEEIASHWYDSFCDRPTVGGRKQQ